MVGRYLNARWGGLTAILLAMIWWHLFSSESDMWNGSWCNTKGFNWMSQCELCVSSIFLGWLRNFSVPKLPVMRRFGLWGKGVGVKFESKHGNAPLSQDLWLCRLRAAAPESMAPSEICPVLHSVEILEMFHFLWNVSLIITLGLDWGLTYLCDRIIIGPCSDSDSTWVREVQRLKLSEWIWSNCRGRQGRFTGNDDGTYICVRSGRNPVGRRNWGSLAKRDRRSW